MGLSVHVQRPPDEQALARLRRQLDPGIELTLGPQLPQPARYDLLVAGRPEREEITASPNLQGLIIPWAGLPGSTRELLLEFPSIAVYNLHHNAVPVAELVVTLLLAAAKFVVPMDRALREHDWRPRYRPNPALLMEGRWATILGFGAIGRHVAQICQGLGMRVRAIRRHVASERQDGVEIHPPQALHRLLADTTALLICLPHTPETDGLIGAEELALLPERALVVNVGRGPIVDQGALYRALQTGQIYAAGLDVWYNYPHSEEERAHTPPADHPFHELDNVVMSPHRAGGSLETSLRRMDRLAELLNAAARGEEIPNRVDVEAGY